MTALSDLRNRGKVGLARALAALEASPDAPEVTGLLDVAHRAPIGVVLGLTGPPGVGKSTLIDSLIRALRARGKTVAVIAVDPSSRISGGALLGDRTRFSTDPEDEGVFVRSMAARDRLGGVAEITYPASILMRALYDLVIVETVGVGQSETQIADMADMVAFCAQPGSGDALQFMKAGVMEIPDLVIVTKGDLTKLADRTVTDLRGALSLAAPGHEAPAIIRCSAQNGEGVAEILDWVDRCVESGCSDRRPGQARRWAERHLLDRFGQEGLSAIRNRAKLDLSHGPFAEIATLSERLRSRIFEAF